MLLLWIDESILSVNIKIVILVMDFLLVKHVNVLNQYGSQSVKMKCFHFSDEKVVHHDCSSRGPHLSAGLTVLYHLLYNLLSFAHKLTWILSFLSQMIVLNLWYNCRSILSWSLGFIWEDDGRKWNWDDASCQPYTSDTSLCSQQPTSHCR